MIAQDLPDQGLGLGADLRCLCSAIGGGRHKVGQFLRRIIRVIGYKCPGEQRPAVGLDQLFIQKDMNQAAASPHPNLLSDKTGGERVKRAVKDDMMIGMNSTLFPLGTFERFRRKRLQTGSFFFLENLKGTPLRGAVKLHADLLPAPGKRPFVGLIDVPKISARQEMPPHDSHHPFHLSLVFGFSHLGRVGYESIVPLQIGIGPVQYGVVDVGFNHARL
jgi:hypothetical protein